ncbi:MAG: S9 family peptidase [Chloroflexota bacterium]|nr:S9 family peptidase [Chloroflexota bacterium]
MVDVSIDAYLDLPVATSPAWLDGGRIAFISDASGVPNVWVARPGEHATALTTFSDRVGTLAASPDGRTLVCTVDAGGDERHQLWRLDPATSDARPLTDAPETIHAFGAFDPDGRRVVLASNGRDPRYFGVSAIDVERPERSPEPVLARDEHLYPVAVLDDGTLLIRRDNTNLDTDLLRLDRGATDYAMLTPHEGEAAITGAAFGPDDGSVWCLSNQDRDTAALVRIDPETLRQDVVVSGDWDVESLAVGRVGPWLAYGTNVDGSSELTLRRRDTGEERAVTGLPLGVADGLRWSPDGQRLAFAFSGPADPGSIWTCGLDGGATPLLPSATPPVDLPPFRLPEVIRYATFDGRLIPAFWYRPVGDGPWPVVVDVHGGPESQRRTQFAPTTQCFLARGFAVLAPNVRGSTGYGKAYCHLDDRDLRMDAVADLDAAAGWLAGRDDVMTDRIAVMGQSYGGFMTLSALVTYPGRWCAGVDVVGIANFETFLERTGPWRRANRSAEYGDLERDREMLRAISPIHAVAQIRVPLLVIHGANDPRVPLHETEQIVEAVRRHGGRADLVVFDDEGHGLVKRANRVRGYGEVVTFLERLGSAEPVGGEP